MLEQTPHLTSAITDSARYTVCRLARCVSQCLLEYVLQWLCVHATHADTQISAMVVSTLANSAEQAERSHRIAHNPDSSDDAAPSVASTAATTVSARSTPSVSQLLDWLSLLCDSQLGLLSSSGGGSESLLTASRLVRCARYLINAHFHPAANTAKHCHALAKAIQQQQQLSGRSSRQRTAQRSRSQLDASQTAYSVEFTHL